MKATYTSTQFNTLYKDFKTLNQVRGYKTGQGNLYPQAVKEFLQWVEQNGIHRLQQVVPMHLNQYYNHLIQRENKRRTGTLSDSSIHHHLFGIKLFFEMAQEMGVTIKIGNIPRHKPRTKLTKEVLTTIDIQEMYNKCSNRLEKAMLSLAYGCGLRRAEVEKLELGDVSLSTGFVFVREGKGGKRREVPMSDFVQESLTQYIRYERVVLVNHSKPTNAVLLSKWGTRARGMTLCRYLNEIIQRCSLRVQQKQPTLHSLRHAMATHLAEQGADVHFIKEFLGHTNIDTSQLYIIQRKRNNQTKRKL